LTNSKLIGHQVKFSVLKNWRSPVILVICMSKSCLTLKFKRYIVTEKRKKMPSLGRTIMSFMKLQCIQCLSSVQVNYSHMQCFKKVILNCMCLLNTNKNTKIFCQINLWFDPDYNYEALLGSNLYYLFWIFHDFESLL
jgi:hypothetical protein